MRLKQNTNRSERCKRRKVTCEVFREGKVPDGRLWVECINHNASFYEEKEEGPDMDAQNTVKCE